MICVSLRQRDEEGLIRATRRAAEGGADLVEWRLDGLRHPPRWPLDLDLLPCPIIATCRRPRDGGEFRGTEQERLATLREAGARGAAWIDVELDALGALGPVGGARRLVSWHDLTDTPSDLETPHRALSRCGADACKLVTTARRASDNARLLALCAAPGPPTVAFCMGELGVPSRLLACRAGAPWTYAAPDGDPAVAPGQLPLSDMIGLYRHRDIEGATRFFALAGDPVEHSIGPKVHNAALAALGLNRRYLPLRLPAAELPDLLAIADALSIDGLSVTAPHKEAVLPLCAPDPTAAAVGACNTLVRGPEGWRGHNTDLPAAVETIEGAWSDARRGGLAGARALLLGGGGVARAVAFGLAGRGVSVTIACRSARGETLARAVGGEAVPWAARHEPAADILVNCTPIGMHPDTTGCPFEPRALDPSTVVFDTVYRPRPTALLRAAAARGCAVADGLEMFLAQARAQVQLFAGLPPPPGLCRRAALAALPAEEGP